MNVPFFDVLCAEHGLQETFSQSPADLVCPICENKATRIYSAPPKAIVEFRDGWDSGAGQHFSTKRDRDNWLSSHHMRKVRS